MTREPIGLGDITWALGWAAACTVVNLAIWNGEGRVVQFLIQFGLLFFGAAIPVLLAVNASSRPPKMSLRWQVAILIAVASVLAGPPWTSPAVGSLP